jgi:hypothetical protein
MTLFGVGLILGGCVLLAAALLGMGRGRRARPSAEDGYDPDAYPSGEYRSDEYQDEYRRDEYRSDDDRRRRRSASAGGNNHRARHVAPPRIQRSALLAKTVLLSVVRADVRRSRVYQSKAYDGVGRNVAGARRDPYRKNVPLPPPPARRLPLSQIPTRENSRIPLPPRDRAR